MRGVRIFYMLDGVQKYEDIEPKFVRTDRYDGFVDTYAMQQHATQYADCLREMGARQVELRWGDEKYS